MSSVFRGLTNKVRQINKNLDPRFLVLLKGQKGRDFSDFFDVIFDHTMEICDRPVHYSTIWYHMTSCVLMWPLLVFCWFLIFCVSSMFLMPLVDLGIHLEFMFVLQSASDTWKLCCCMCLFFLFVCFGVVCLCGVLQATTMHACTKWHYTTQVVHSVAVSDAWMMTSTHVKTIYLYVYICINLYTLAYIHMNSLYILCKLE